MSSFDEKILPATRRIHPWLQGVMLGLFIGAAFVGGWTLAKNGYESKDTPVNRSTLFAVTDAGNPPPTPANDAPVPDASDDTDTPANPIASDEPATADATATATTEANADSPTIKDSKNLKDPKDSKEPTTTTAPTATPAPASPTNAAPKPAAKPTTTATTTSPAIPGPALIRVRTEPGTKIALLLGSDKEPTPLGEADKNGLFEISIPAPDTGLLAALSFEHADFEKQSRTLIFAAGKTTALETHLAPKSGTLAIFATPSDTEVFVDGTPRGRGAVTIGVTPHKKHIVEFRAAGTRAVRREAIVKPGTTQTVRVNLSPDKGTTGDILFLGAMRTLVRESGVLVSVDGKSVPTVDGLIRNLTPGLRRVVISRIGAAKRANGETPPPLLLWERDVKIEAGSASSFGDADAPAALAAALPAIDERNLVRLTLTVMDEQGRSVAPSTLSASFNGAALTPLPGGAWPLPVGRSGTLEISAPGSTGAERSLHFNTPGTYYLSVVLRAAPVPLRKQWRVRVKAVSKENAMVILSDTPGQTVAAGQTLALVPPRAGAELLKLSVIETSGGNVVCQILPGQASLEPPAPGMAVTVRLHPAAEPPKPR